MDERLNAIAMNLVEKAPIGILVVADKTALLANTALCELLELEKNQLEAKPLDQLPAILVRVTKELREPFLIPGDDKRKAKWLRTTAIKIDASANLLAYYVNDVTEEYQVQQETTRLRNELKSLTIRDEVTGLPNRQALMQALEPLISRSRRYDNPLSIIRLKVHDITKLDSELGAGGQDKVLLGIAHLLRDQLRWADVVGRYETDEFLLILPETPEIAAKSLIEKINTKLAEAKIPCDKGTSLPLNMVFGIAAWSKGDDAKKLLQRATPA